MNKDENSYSLLVIEDNVGDFVILEDYFAEYLVNLQIEHVENFKDASEILSEKKKHFDLIFLDLSLPDKSGEDLVLEIVRMAADIPVVVLTGYSDIEFGSRSLGLGATDYLLKDELSPIVLYKSLLYNIQRTKFISELKESNIKYSELFQLNPSPILVYDQLTLQFIDVNLAALLKYGYDRDEFLRKSLKDIRPEVEQQKLDNAIKDFWANNNPNYQQTTKHVKNNGEVIDVEVKPAKIKINNRDAGMVLVNDITENLKHIRKIEEQNETLKQIAWIQSHVVRAPLARLMGLVSLLENTDESIGDESREILRYIKDSAGELDGVIREISKKSELISKKS